MGFLSNSSDLMFWIDGVRMGLSLRRLLRDSSRLRGFFRGGGGQRGEDPINIVSNYT